MKLLALISSHKIVVATISVGILGSGAGAMVIHETKKPIPEQLAVSTYQSVAKKVPKAEVDKPKSEPTEQKDEVKIAPQPIPKQQKAEAAPKVLATQEYGEKYLDLSTSEYQECFDAIVTAWPNRFTPKVREQNVKALSIWGSICGATNSYPASYFAAFPMVNLYRAKDGSRGLSGEFFDSEAAKAQHSKTAPR